MDKLIEYLPVLAPLIIIQFILLVTALVNVLKAKSFNFGNKIMWVLISFVSFAGPIAYFAFGKEKD